ncbi:recombinase family protein [Kribbella qitaiheensis]|uniref:Recombinase family protein n=1 Tax=Kribbella qitaiheensis TaxID=1544730 RepID=A0A7G6X0A0_9ACTN|nr:recombinase family protein [Kribbella qitaiheensis]QNE19665.1 recombinase family protein [Kribbella qitaiheensis]
MTKSTAGPRRRSANLQAGKAKQAAVAALVMAPGVAGVGAAGGGLGAREYLRVSSDKSGVARSPEEQHDENAEEASRVGFVLGKPYRDDNRSASRYKQREREDFERLIADLEADTFGAQVLMLWESSRGSREVGEWVYLIDLCESRGVLIHVTTHHRTYDPANGRDRRSLIEDATDSEYDAWKISQRSLRAIAADARAGKPHGRVPFGYRRQYDGLTRKFVAQEPDPNEAPIVAKLFARLEARHSLREIAAEFDREGYRTRSGKPWTSEHLRALALNRVYIGERVYDPGRKGGLPNKETVQYLPGQWDALVSRDQFFAVQEILADKTRSTTRPGRGIHLVSMIGRCGKCGGCIAVRFKNERAEYTCHKRGCVRIGKAEVDVLAERAIKGFVKRKDVYSKFAQRSGNGKALKAVRDEIADIRAEHRDLADKLGRGEISPMLAAGAEPGILARLLAAEGREKELTTPAEMAGILDPGQDVDQWWEDAPMSTRRLVARYLLVPEWLGYLAVLPAPSPGPRCEPEDRVKFLTDWDPDSIPAPPKRQQRPTASQKAAAAEKTPTKPRTSRKAQ